MDGIKQTEAADGWLKIREISFESVKKKPQHTYKSMEREEEDEFTGFKGRQKKYKEINAQEQHYDY